MSKTPDDFYKTYLGKAIDYDKGYGVQCVDGFRVFCQWAFGTSWPTGNGWADGYWYNREKYSKYFTFVSAKDLKNGDWVIWARGSKSHPSSHIAMYYNHQSFGQNQHDNKYGAGFSLHPANFADALGGLRWRGWPVPKPATTPTKTSNTSSNSLKVAHGFNKSYNRSFKTTANLNIREGHSTSCKSLGVLPKGATFRCYGYYDGNWLYGTSTVGNRNYTGFCYKDYLR